MIILICKFRTQENFWTKRSFKLQSSTQVIRSDIGIWISLISYGSRISLVQRFNREEERIDQSSHYGCLSNFCFIFQVDVKVPEISSPQFGPFKIFFNVRPTIVKFPRIRVGPLQCRPNRVCVYLGLLHSEDPEPCIRAHTLCTSSQFFFSFPFLVVVIVLFILSV